MDAQHTHDPSILALAAMLLERSNEPNIRDLLLAKYRTICSEKKILEQLLGLDRKQNNSSSLH